MMRSLAEKCILAICDGLIKSINCTKWITLRAISTPVENAERLERLRYSEQRRNQLLVDQSFGNFEPSLDSLAISPPPLFSKWGYKLDVFDAVGLYSRFGDLYPSRKIRKSSVPRQFKYASTSLSLTYIHEGAAKTLLEYFESNPVTGMLIALDDTILFESYRYSRLDRDHCHTQSVAKTFVAVLIGIAIEEGYIGSIDDQVQDYVAGLDGTEYGTTSIHDLLNMASGVRFSEDLSGKDDLSVLNRELFSSTGMDPISAVSKFNTRIAPPGTIYRYASIEAEILGLVLTHATNKSVSEYLGQKIWSEIGTESNATWTTDHSGQEITYCGISATLRDYARFARLLAQDGNWDGKQLIPKKWLIAATSEDPDRQFLAPDTAMPYFGYGYMVRIFPGQRRMFELHGQRGQSIFVDPTSKLTLVHTGVLNLMSAAEEEVLNIWLAALKVVAGHSADPPSPEDYSKDAHSLLTSSLAEYQAVPKPQEKSADGPVPYVGRDLP